MVNKIKLLWFAVIRKAFDPSTTTGESEWISKAVLLTNLGIGLIGSGVVMKLGLRIFGLNNVWFLLSVALVCIPLYYLLAKSTIGFNINSINRSALLQKTKNMKLGKTPAIIITLLYLPICFYLMIIMMIIF